MLNCSKVFVAGNIIDINADTRDIKVKTLTPGGRDVTVTVHMWKVNGIDSDDAAHAGRADWKSDLLVDDFVVIMGHMGNNGRVIATTYSRPTEASAAAEGGMA